MTESERREAINAYVRRRLIEECATHGRASEISRGTGFTKSFISYVIRGERTMSTQFVDAVAALWGLSFADLERFAEELHRARSDRATIPTRLPNLRATIEWCRGSFPDEFLDACEERLGQEDEDRPKRAWLTEIEAALWHWSRKRPSRQGPQAGAALLRYPTRGEQKKGDAGANEPAGHTPRRPKKPA